LLDQAILLSPSLDRHKAGSGFGYAERQIQPGPHLTFHDTIEHTRRYLHARGEVLLLLLCKFEVFRELAHGKPNYTMCNMAQGAEFFAGCKVWKM